MKRGAVRTIASILCVLIGIQLLRMGVKQVLFAFVGRTLATDTVVSLVALILLTALFVLLAHWRRIPLSVFPRRFGPVYILATALAGALIVTSPYNAAGGGTAIAALIYGSIAIPAFEELIFRGYVWNQLKARIRREWVVYLLSAALFGLWHLGYWDSVAYRAHEGIVTIMAWKALTGLCYGLVLGALRLWTKNCYATMLLHGVMNVFGR